MFEVWIHRSGLMKYRYLENTSKREKYLNSLKKKLEKAQVAKEEKS